MRVVLVLFVLLSPAFGKNIIKLTLEKFAPQHILFDDLWLNFKKEYTKTYESLDKEISHAKAFKANLEKITRHNERYNQGNEEFELGLNSLADLPQSEYQKRNGYRRPEGYVRRGKNFIEPNLASIPDSVDWRTKGFVTSVKDQGQCGSCWAFSSTGSLEGQHKRQAGDMVSLSEQNLVDCSFDYGNNGCEGGLMDNAFEYIKDNHGIDTEAGYPYKGKEGRCRFSRKKVGANDTGFIDIPEGNEDALKKAVATIGPVSVAIDASPETFQLYQKGVYYDKECSSTQLNHGVLVVGYGTSKDKKDYWIVKNSWGTKWGDDGYILMARNRKNHCGIATAASYPTVD